MGVFTHLIPTKEKRTKHRSHAPTSSGLTGERLSVIQATLQFQRLHFNVHVNIYTETRYSKSC